MTTERMTDERREDLRGYLDRQYVKAHEAAEINAELDRARRVEQEQAEKIRALEEERDVAVIKAAHLQKRLDVAHESISFANDKMVERERQARWEVADGALLLQPKGRERYLEGVRDANAPKD